MMDKELATLLDATSFQVADLVGPAIVIEGAANHLLSRLPETDDHRWKVTEALGSIVAARKSLESAAEALLHIVAQDGADMLAMEVDGGTIVEKAQCQSRYAAPFDTDVDQPTRCRRDAGHVGIHDDHEYQWNDVAAYRDDRPGDLVRGSDCTVFKPMIYDDPDICFTCGLTQGAH